MRSLLAGAAGLLLLLAGLGFYRSNPGNHTERIIISGSSSPYFVQKPDLRMGHFQVDYGYTTTFEITSSVGHDVNLQIDASIDGQCRIRFDDPGDLLCQSKVVTVQPNAPPIKLTATGASMFPWEYYMEDLGFPTYPSAVKVGDPGSILVPVDPELEIERDYSFASLIAWLMALLSFGLAWRWRRR